jgi:hypothetical protein
MQNGHFVAGLPGSGPYGDKALHKSMGLRLIFRSFCAFLFFASYGFAAETNNGTEEKLQVFTNQKSIEGLWGPESLDIENPASVLSFVFSGLPPEVHVYPTENYYYFSFFHNGVKYAGNLRLDKLDRDDGVVHFAYFSAFTRWNEELVSKYKKLTSQDGILISKSDELTYVLSLNGKDVKFHLNDLRDVVPGPDQIREEEAYIGPIYDESALQFYLVYNYKLHLFHYILNTEHAPPEIFSPGRIFKDLEIGARTGFAFYKDKFMNRKILVGVYEGNSMVNNYFDGSFDQLPDNFIKGDTLRDAFVDESPEIAGKIDRFGNTDKGASRVLITPYLHYSTEYDFTVIADCTDRAWDDKELYYGCFKVNPNALSRSLEVEGGEYSQPAPVSEDNADTNDAQR